MILHSKDATDPAQAGGKGASLARLAAEGFTPPAFFVITPDAFDPKPAPGLAKTLTEALQKLGPGPYAVRSSGRAEDRVEHSHAGQLDTVLNIAAEDVITAAAQVWCSGFSDTVKTYRALKTGAEAEAPAIVVQRMIDARASGVAFSADPVSGRRDHVVVSAIEGLGDRLVSGEEDGTTWTVGTEIEGPVDGPLTPDEIKQVADLARRAEAAFGTPQDIEWAIDGDGLHILQARPITTALRPLPILDETVTILDNSNIVESYPGLVTPLTYSFATHVYDRVYRAFVALLGVRPQVIEAKSALFANMLSRADGRVYYNLLNWYRALALLPGFALNRDYMETMMGVDEPLPPDIAAAIGPPAATGAAKLREYARLSRTALGLATAAIRLPRTRRDFYARLNRALEEGAEPETATPTELAAEYRRIEADLLDRWDAPLVNDFLCMIAFGASRKLLEKWLGPQGLTLHNDVMIGQGDIVSAEPARRIGQIAAMVAEAGLADALRRDGLAALGGHPAISAEVDAYLDRFGDRCTEELKLESLPLTDDPTQLLAAIAAQADRPPASHDAPPDPDWDALFQGHPLRKAIAKRLIPWTKARVRDRENLRFERTRIFGRARRVFCALGTQLHARGHLDEPRDIFWLTVAEALGAVEGAALSPNLAAIAKARRAEDVASAERPDPPMRITLTGPAIYVPVAETHTLETQTGTSRQGTGCSAGTVTATARVIRDPRTESLTPGEILIARHTDPGWIAVFSNASAIVVERGSLLSHSAIVARELGIPCVVGLKDATRWVESGETLRVDGATGEVTKT
ncbi:MAG: PEP/pyruvate-binding domain-containing protein [Pseudomonadota bacterium]